MSGNENQARFERAVAAWQNQQFDEAKGHCAAVLQGEPGHAHALHLMALLAHRTGENARAAELIGKAIGVAADEAAFYVTQGAIFLQTREWAAAAASYDKAIALGERSAGIYQSRGDALREAGQLEAALASYDAVIAIDPQRVEAHVNRGSALLTLGRGDDAIVSYRNGLQLRPQDPKLHAILGTVLYVQGRRDEAAASFQQSIALESRDSRTYYKLGDVLREQGKVLEAEQAYRQSIALNAQSAESQMKLGALLQGQGRLAEAEARCRLAVALRPDTATILSSLIFVLDLTTAATTASLQAVRKQWAERFAPPHFDPSPFANMPDPDRRLRIGYVSADFQEHSAAFVFGAMLIQFNPSQFEVFVYSNSSAADRMAQQFRRSVTQWREIKQLSADAAAALIREDGIDILVDLSGHSSGNRLDVFARKPAPVQITAWGYITGTGMKAIDVLFADPVIIPEDEKALYTEEIVYLPNVVCGGFFLTKYPDVNPLPAASGQGITFGSFNRLAKISDTTIKAWTRVLTAVPDSKMIIKAPGLEHAHVRQRFEQDFSAAGMDLARITFQGRTSWWDHLSAYNQVDMFLDAFPHSGGVTTLDSLMMGVPVVTLRWPTLVGRLSASFLTTIGLTDWIAETEDAFVNIAVQKAKDIDALKELRQSLRMKLRHSIIGDTKAYVAAVEGVYRNLWRRWCARQS